jgi:UDPglucose 6-dehydrogenase
LRLVEGQYDAIAGADALVMITEWKSLRHPNFVTLKEQMKQPIIFDGRNQFDPRVARAGGFDYAGIGR